MAANKDTLNRSLDHISQSSKKYINETESIIQNMRWITTLILAEIAGLAAYRELLGKKGLSFPFAIIVIFLAISLSIFIIGVISARSRIRTISSVSHRTNMKFLNIFNDSNIAPKQGDVEIINNLNQSLNDISTLNELIKIFEFYGLLVFLFSSLAAAVIIFFAEFFSFLKI